ncbi:MAG TPA: hypothetical protein VM030_04680 [Acidimicrobiales bacterium]|nr:hypothetical protein [Acidimicrobiales bacterium]
MLRSGSIAETRRAPSAAAVISFVVVTAAALFVFIQMRPDLLLANTTPAGGDMGAHVWGPAYLRDHLLPHGRLTGWTPDWYAGFPALHFYFPLPSLLIVLLDVVLPYSIAFKLVSVLGVVSLPVAAWAMGRIAGMGFPGPACLAVATLPFLFDRTFTIYGGNIPSTLAGEFAFSISLSVALVFLGVVARGLETGRHRTLAAVLLALTGLCHVVPAFFALAGMFVLLVLRFDRRRTGWLLTVGAVGALLAAFWVLPFMARIAYTNDMGWEKLVTYRKTLFPPGVRWVPWVAVLGVVGAVTRRRMFGIALSVLTVLAGLAFVAAPQSRLWNARLLPFWFLLLYLLVGVAVAELAHTAANYFEWKRPTPLPINNSKDDVDEDAYDETDEDVLVDVLPPPPPPPPVDTEGRRMPELLAPVAALVAALVLVAMPLGKLPAWLGLKTTDRSFVPDWVRWNYSGYERKPAYPEYRDLVATMDDLGRTRGCGRAMWEYEPQLDRLGTPMALMLLPYWTGGCIGSMEGLFFESSATTPYHFLDQSELSQVPSRAQRDLPYRSLDVAKGVEHLQLLGVRYYMALTPEAVAQASVHPALTRVATSGPWSVHYDDGDETRTWEIYEVAGAAQVAPLRFEPVVMRGVDKGGREWLNAAVGFYQDRARWDVPLAVSGPAGWARVRGAAKSPPRRPVRPVKVSRIRTGDDRISFDVDHPGSPVLVKTSYFPNWKASGAQGPWRVTPNQMVVIPTSRHVELHYSQTPVDLGAWALTIVGVAAAVGLARRPPMVFPERSRRRRRRRVDAGMVESVVAPPPVADADDLVPIGAAEVDSNR